LLPAQHVPLRGLLLLRFDSHFRKPAILRLKS